MITILTALCSGLIASIITQIYANRSAKYQERNNQKFNILKQLMANRTVLTRNYSPEEEYKFFEALNSAFVVFHDNKKISSVLNKFHTNPHDVVNNTYELIKEICDDINIDISELDKSFLEKPFQRS